MGPTTSNYTQPWSLAMIQVYYMSMIIYCHDITINTGYTSIPTQKQKTICPHRNSNQGPGPRNLVTRMTL